MHVQILDRGGALQSDIPLKCPLPENRQCCCKQLQVGVLQRMLSAFMMMGYAFQWDALGEHLAILQRRPCQLLLWRFSSSELRPLHLDSKVSFLHSRPKTNSLFAQLGDVSVILWAPESPVLLIGTTKGEIVLYKDLEKRKTLVERTHNSKAVVDIICVNKQHFAIHWEDKRVSDRFQIFDEDPVSQIGLCDITQEKIIAEIRLKKTPTETTCRSSPKRVRHLLHLSSL